MSAYSCFPCTCHAHTGILAHTDGPAYLSHVIIISLEDSVKFRFTARSDTRRTPVASLIVQPRSALIFTGDAYSQYLHDIPDCFDDVVDETVINCALASVAIGDVIPRARTRIRYAYSICIMSAIVLGCWHIRLVRR